MLPFQASQKYLLSTSGVIAIEVSQNEEFLKNGKMERKNEVGSAIH